MPEQRLRFRVSIFKLIKNLQPNNVLNFYLENKMPQLCRRFWFCVPCRRLSASTLAIFWGSPIRRTTSVLSIARTVTLEAARTEACRIASFMISQNISDLALFPELAHAERLERNNWFLWSHSWVGQGQFTKEITLFKCCHLFFLLIRIFFQYLTKNIFIANTLTIEKCKEKIPDMLLGEWYKMYNRLNTAGQYNLLC